MSFVLVHAPGHGGKDLGNTVIQPCERDWNLSMAMDVDVALRPWFVDAHFSRTTNDVNPSPKDEADLADLVEADLSLLYHVDVNDSPRAHGMHVFAKEGDTQAILAGTRILAACPNDLKGPWVRTIGVAPGETAWPRVWNCLAPFRRPALLIEFGFASNAMDKQVLETPQRRIELVVSVLAGIAAVIGGRK